MQNSLQTYKIKRHTRNKTKNNKIQQATVPNKYAFYLHDIVRYIR